MYEKSYEKEITVYQYECDVKNRMTAAALLKQVQQISTEHCDIFGLDAAYYQSTNTAFLLSKISLLFHREILVGEKLKLVTQPSLPIKAVFAPKRAADTATLAGAPPGLAAKAGIP